MKMQCVYLFATLLSLGVAVILVERVWGGVALQVLLKELGAYFLHVRRHRKREVEEGERRIENQAIVGCFHTPQIRHEPGRREPCTASTAILYQIRIIR